MVKNILLVISLITVLLLSVFIIVQNNNNEKKHTTMEQNFRSELGRISGAIKENNLDIALEHAVRADSLYPYIEIFDNSHVNYTAILVSELRTIIQRDAELLNADTLSSYLIELSSDPVNNHTATKLLQLLLQSSRTKELP